MRFIYQEEDGIHSYETEDVFGMITITAPFEITAEQLDDMVVLLVRQKASAGVLKGAVRLPDGTVEYTFKRRPQWLEDEEIELCNDIPMSKKKQADASIRQRLLTTQPLRWLQKFVAAFREAYKKTHGTTRGERQ